MTEDLVLVTGASGYLAQHCIVQLLEQGYRVRGTLRAMTRAAETVTAVSGALRDRGLASRFSVMEAELTTPTDWAAPMADVRYVLHVASPIPATMPRSAEELIKPAREGTLNVMRAAAAGGVERVVQTSSSTAVAYGCAAPNGRVFTEQDWSDPDHPDNNAYSRSKTVAERAAWEALPSLPRALEWTAITPGLILGPVMSKDARASVQVVAKLLKGEMPGLPRLAWQVVDVRDIADLHVRAMTARAAAGQRYIGAGEFVTMTQIAEILRRELGADGAKVATRGLPDWLIRLVGLFDPEVGGQTFELGKERRLSSAKARDELGWTTRPVAQTIIDTATSLARTGALA